LPTSLIKGLPPQRRPLKLEAVGIVNYPVQHGVGGRGTLEQAMIFGNGQLRGDDRGTFSEPILKNVQQPTAFQTLSIT